MIETARAKAIYDVLHTEDILTTLDRERDLDLIIAVDTLVYLGNLEAVFLKTHDALAEKGLFAFTVEKTTEYPHILQETARYAHHKRYIEELAQKSGFEICRFDNIIARQQHKKPLEGYLYILRRG